MTPKDKRKFINDLIGSVRKSILANVGQMPEVWDGHELRQYIADRFEAQTTNIRGQTLREYRNEVAVRNL